MANGAYSKDVDELRASLGGSMATLLEGSGFAMPAGGDRGRRRMARGVAGAAAGAGGRSRVEGTPSGLGEGALRDERSMRALAKEIKRLITEDARRGIGI